MNTKVDPMALILFLRGSTVVGASRGPSNDIARAYADARSGTAQVKEEIEYHNRVKVIALGGSFTMVHKYTQDYDGRVKSIWIDKRPI